MWPASESSASDPETSAVTSSTTKKAPIRTKATARRVPFGVFQGAFRRVGEGEFEQVTHVRILQAVEDLPALPPRGDHAMRTQQGEGVGDTGCRVPGPVRQIGDTQLPRQQGHEQADPTGIAQESEDVGHVLHLLRAGSKVPRRHPFLNICRTVHMCMVRVGRSVG
jgi:hypothetical protein